MLIPVTCLDVSCISTYSAYFYLLYKQTENVNELLRVWNTWVSLSSDLMQQIYFICEILYTNTASFNIVWCLLLHLRYRKFGSLVTFFRRIIMYFLFEWSYRLFCWLFEFFHTATISHFLKPIFLLVLLKFTINLGTTVKGKLDLLSMFTFSSKWKRNC